jgi:hypothetical protein
MKRLAIIMLALIAINSSTEINSVEVKTTIKTTKIVRTVKRPKKKINRRLIRKRLTSYGKKKGMNFEPNLKVNNSSWLPPLTIKYYINNKELISAGKEAIKDLLDYFERYEPGDISFNVIASKKYLYIVYR